MALSLRLPQLNDVRLVGRLTRDPELRFTAKSTAVCHFDLAVNRRYKDQSGEWKDDTSFVPIVVWREAGQRCGERLKKGSAVLVEGRIKSRSWETKEGQKRTGLEVDASRVQFLDKMETGGGNDEDGPSASSAGETPVLGASAESASVAEEIPF